MKTARDARRQSRRKGSILVLAVVLIVVMLAAMAFAFDLGYILLVRTQAQGCADAAALAAAWEMGNERRLSVDSDTVYSYARDKAVEYAALENVNGLNLVLDRNDANYPDGQIVFGRLDNPSNLSEQLSYFDYDDYNTVRVRVECTPERSSAVPLFFARLFGMETLSVTAEGAAIFEDGNTSGFGKDDDVPCSLMPFVVHVDDWENLLTNGGPDQWSYDPDTRTVSSDSDGRPEMKMFPNKIRQNRGRNQGTGITPGNFGTVDIGDMRNGAPDLLRQIREGPSAADLEPYGGELCLDPTTGTLLLNGDTGMTASMHHALADIVGLPRTIMLYSTVTGVGNNTWFTIVGFAGIRVVDYSMQGQDKYILIQPAVVYDRNAIPGEDGSSYFVAQPVRLVR